MILIVVLALLTGSQPFVDAQNIRRERSSSSSSAQASSSVQVSGTSSTDLQAQLQSGFEAVLQALEENPDDLNDVVQQLVQVIVMGIQNLMITFLSDGDIDASAVSEMISSAFGGAMQSAGISFGDKDVDSITAEIQTDVENVLSGVDYSTDLSTITQEVSSAVVDAIGGGAPTITFGGTTMTSGGTTITTTAPTITTTPTIITTTPTTPTTTPTTPTTPSITDNVQSPSSTIGFSAGGASGVENFRRSIEENFLPSPLDITYEGIIDEYYFDTQTKNKNNNSSFGCEQLFCAGYSVEISQDPLVENSPQFDFYITVGLESNLLLENFSRKSLNIVLVLDVSSSMGSQFIIETNHDPEKISNQFNSKLDVAKIAIIDMLQMLNNNDSLSIVTFSTFAETLIKLTPFGELNMQDVEKKINLLQYTDSTNMEEGYRMASQILRDCSECMYDRNYENRIIFLTDAQPNLGDTSAIGLYTQVEKNAGNSIFTTFVGVGLDFNTELSEALTKTRGANYFIVGSPEEFRQKLVEQFDFMVTPLVFDLKLEIDPQSFNNGTGWKVVKVYGSPNLDGGLDTEGIFVEINTLFPSPKTNEGTKGGVVLLKMQRPQNSEIPLTLQVSYKDRTTLEKSTSFSEVKIPDEQFNLAYFDSTGAQKAVLLARYVDLLRGWIIDQHKQLDTQQQNEQLQLDGPVTLSMELCEYYPVDRIVKKQNSECEVENFVQPESQILPVFESIFQNNDKNWQKVWLQLAVSKQQGEAMQQFLIYLQDTIDELDDETLEQEVAVLVKLIEISGK